MGFERVHQTREKLMAPTLCANQTASFEFLTLKQGQRRGMQGGTFTPRRTYCTCLVRTYVLCCCCREYIHNTWFSPRSAIKMVCVLAGWCKGTTTERVQPLFRSISYICARSGAGSLLFFENRHPCCEREPGCEQRILHPHRRRRDSCLHSIDCDTSPKNSRIVLDGFGFEYEIIICAILIV
jgi:hypothetical protein